MPAGIQGFRMRSALPDDSYHARIAAAPGIALGTRAPAISTGIGFNTNRQQRGMDLHRGGIYGGDIDTGNRGGIGTRGGIPGYDAATTNWKRQMDLARPLAASGGIRTNGAGIGLFTRDRQRLNPARSKLDRLTDAQVAIERAKNEGTLGAAEIQAGASRYGADRQYAGQGLQEFGATRRAGIAERGGIQRTVLGEKGAIERAGIGLEGQLGAAKIGAESQIGAAKIGAAGGIGQQRIAADANRDVANIQAGVEREKIAADRQPVAMPGFVQVDGVWGMRDPKTGAWQRAPDTDQKRLTMVRNLADAFPRSVTQPELDAFAADPSRYVPVYDYQTGRVALKEANPKSSTFKKNWLEETIGTGNRALLRFQPLIDFEPSAYQAFMEWASSERR